MTNKILVLQTVRFLLFSFIIMLLFPAVEVCGKDSSATGGIPDKGKRSSIHSIDGYAYLSENMTIAQSRITAFANARRQALEAAKSYIKSKTKVKDFQIEYDMIWSDAEGGVTILEQKDFGVEDNKRYHVWIKAEVEYALRPQAKKSKPVLAMDQSPFLTVKVWTQHKRYKKGENIQIYIQGNRDFYARIVDIAPGREIIQLLPNDFRRINFFESGKVYKIPDKGDRFVLRVTPPFGEDTIVVYASEVPLGKVEMEQIGQGLRKYCGSRKSLANKTRGISIFAADHIAGSGAEFYEGTWNLTTEK